VLLVVGADANDQHLLQRAPFYNAFIETYHTFEAASGVSCAG
jgi:hypothetical protein